MAITVLIHSSKTMRSSTPAVSVTKPQLMSKTRPLARYIKTLNPTQLQAIMNISESLAREVHDMLRVWGGTPDSTASAIDSFVGDMYSGLRANALSQDDRDYAQQTLRIVSGLYGVLRPYDGAHPYRLEMGYKLPIEPFANLYEYWRADIAKTLPRVGLIINVSVAEYTKAVLQYIDTSRLVTPRFLTWNAKTNQPSQVIVYTKIARGAFARWLIMSRTTSLDAMTQFDDLNYRYEAGLSTPSEPTFVCKTFGGIGLSLRLQKA